MEDCLVGTQQQFEVHAILSKSACLVKTDTLHSPPADNLGWLCTEYEFVLELLSSVYHAQSHANWETGSDCDCDQLNCFVEDGGWALFVSCKQHH